MHFYKNCGELLINASCNKAKGITLIKGYRDEKFISFSRLYNKALYILYNLQSKGVKRDDQLIFQIEDNEWHYYVFWACILGGIVPVPLPMAMNDESKAKMLRIWDTLGRPYLVTNNEVIDSLHRFAMESKANETFKSIADNSILLEEIDPEIKPGIIYEASLDDTAYILFSSGSTGDPKGVVSSHENTLLNAQSMIRTCKMTSDDVTLFWLPLTHAFGTTVCNFIPVMAGMNTYCMKPDLYIREPNIWFDKASEHRATLLTTTNFGLRHYLDNLKEESTKNLELSCIRQLMISAEPISYDLCNDFLDRMSMFGMKRTTLCPVYGMSEVPGIAFTPVEEGFTPVFLDRNHINLGEPIVELSDTETSLVYIDLGFPMEYCRIRICNDENAELGENIVGHIQVKGKVVTRGYYKNPEANRKAFTEDGWMDTGDVGFFIHGRLVITGRTKDIVFINGQNIYFQDIERIALRSGKVASGSLVACSTPDRELQKEEIVLFVAYRGDLCDFVPIAESIRKTISGQMGVNVNQIYPIEQIPKTSSGKIQRFKLVELLNEGYFSNVIGKLNTLALTEDKPFLLSEKLNAVEKDLSGLWKEVLGRYPQTREDSFLENGGNSLKASLLLSKIYKKFGVEVPIVTFFNNPTIDKLGKYISSDVKRDYHPIDIVEEREYYPAYSAQKRLFVLNMFDNTGITYNVPQVMDVEGSIDRRLVERAFIELIKRHEILRTSFVSVNGELMQKVHENFEFRLDFEEASEDDLEELLNGFVKPFDLTDTTCLLRAKLFRLSELKHVLLIDSHHIVMDGTSAGIFYKEFSRLYEGQELPALKLQYKDFAVWQEKETEKDWFKKQEAFWLETFKGDLSPIDLQTDFTRPEVQCFNGGRLIGRIDSDIASKLETLALETGTTLFMILLAAYNILLKKFTGTDDITVGIPVSGRSHPDLENSIGMFVNTLPMRNYPGDTKTFSDFLREVKENTLGAFENQNYQIELLIDRVNIQRDPGRNPLFDTMFIFQNMEINNIDIERIKFSTRSFKPPVSKFDITLELTQRDNGIVLDLEYSTRLFKQESMEGFLKYYSNILAAVGEAREIKIENIEILSEEQKDNIVADIKEMNDNFEIEFDFLELKK